MEKNANALNWFEIPATDINRAKSFYEQIFDMQMEPVTNMGDLQMSLFPVDEKSGKVSGALAQSSVHKPSQDGAIVYLNANHPGMDDILSRVEVAGGQTLMPKTQITPEIGYMAFFLDSEGNKMALHSNN